MSFVGKKERRTKSFCRHTKIILSAAKQSSLHTYPNTGADFQQEPSLTDVRAVRNDFDLKREFYLGEFALSQENVYLIEPSEQTSVIGKTNEIFER